MFLYIYKRHSEFAKHIALHTWEAGGKKEADTLCENKDCAPPRDRCDLTSNCETVQQLNLETLSFRRCKKKIKLDF